jgi:hypothetical protein
MPIIRRQALSLVHSTTSIHDIILSTLLPYFSSGKGYEVTLITTLIQPNSLPGKPTYCARDMLNNFNVREMERQQRFLHAEVNKGNPAHKGYVFTAKFRDGDMERACSFGRIGISYTPTSRFPILRV